MPHQKALVVAIDDYGGPPNDLPSCVADGNAFTRLLQATYNLSDIHTLFDATATVANVDKELDWLVKDAKSDDRLVFYFSGHGYTQLVSDVMEEFLVLRDDKGKPALWLDDKLVAKTQKLPDGALTAVLDCCFSGGFFKLVFDPTGAAAETEIAQVKVYQPPPEEQAKSFASLIGKPAEARPVRVAGYRRFGCVRSTSARAIAKAFALEGVPAGRAAVPKALSDPTEALQPEMNGLLISACLETETASASTSRTDGLSAFTFAMLKALAGLGNRRPNREVFDATAATLKSLGFRQTPLLLERATPGNLRNRTFLTMEARKMVEETETAFAIESEGAAGEEMEKFLPLLNAILPAVIAAAPRVFSATRPRRKEFDLGVEEGPASEEMQKFLPVIAAAVSAVVSAAPGIIRAAGRRKELGLGEAATAPEVTDEEMEKFLPLLTAILPAVISATPGIVSAVRPRPRRKELELGGEAPLAADEETEKILPFIAAAVSAAVSAAPGIIRAARGRRKGLEPGTEASPERDLTEEELQKFLPLLRTILPAVISAVPTVMRTVAGQRKAVGDFEPGEFAEEGDEKIFRAVRRIVPQVLPHVMRAAPVIAQAFGGAQAKAFDVAPGTPGALQEGDEKIFAAILRVLPQVLTTVPGIIQAFGPQQKAFETAPAAGTLQPGDEKIFGAVLRVLPQVLPHVLQTAQGIFPAFGAPQKTFEAPPAAAIGPTQEGDEKIFGAVLRVLPQVLPHVMQAAPSIAQAIAGAQRR